MFRLGLGIAALMALWALTAWPTPPARADVTLSVVPSMVEVAATPGGRGTQQIVVYNEGSEPFQATASVEPYKEATGDRSAVEWLKVEPENLKLAPGQKQTVTVSITVPSNLDSGGRYASAAFKTKASFGNGARTGVSGKLGVPFLISVQGRGPLIRQLTLDRVLPVLEVDGRVGFRALLSNCGNVHVGARGTVEVTRADGSLAGRLEFIEMNALLPQTDDTLAANGSLPLDEGAVYRARAVIDYGGDKPAIGEVTFTPKAALAPVSLSAHENPDRGPTLSLGLRNAGELGLVPRSEFAIRDAQGKMLGEAPPPTPPFIWPGQTVTVETQYGRRLSTGDYVLVAWVQYGTAPPITHAAAFRIGTPSPPPNPNWGDVPTPPKEGASVIRWLAGGTIFVLFLSCAGIAWLPALAPVRLRLVRALKVSLGAQ